MSGLYNGVQARFREINNLAVWVPCAAHSLNLVEVAAAECCTEALNYFGILQKVYSFFAASPHRWQKLKENIKKNSNVLHSLSETRWSARSDATKAFYDNYDEIQKALLSIIDCERQPPSLKHEAKALIKKFENFETPLMCVIWRDILQNINIINTSLQQPGIELCTVVKLYNSLLSYLKGIRDKFVEFENSAKELAPKSEYQIFNRQRKRKIFYDEIDNETDQTTNPSDKFRIQVFYLIIDRLTTELDKRRTAYNSLYERFDFLTEKSMSESEVISKAKNLISIYNEDLEDSFVDEFLLFRNLFPECKTASELLSAQIQRNLVTSFSNTNIALRIYLSILGTNAEGERSFSTLSRIKNHLRSSLSDTKLSSLSVLSIESETLNQLPVEEIIKEFANKKCRKVDIII